ncbi:hypothetical protein ACIQOU_29345 [Streptomyces sp. NPDC091279]|uniref:hypothetical protein n=1 Tax=unclassified Streptomyces TaxID=2593676 RepID=UPI00380B69DE
MQNELIQRGVRAAVVSGTAAAMVFGSVAGAQAAQETTVFTPAKQTYSTPKAKQKAGILHTQVKLTGKYPTYYPMPWSWVITNKKLKAIATSTMSCTATGLNGKYHDKHAAIPVGYHWHSTVGSKAHPHTKKKVYTLTGTCVFNVEVGGKTGQATVSFTFKYAINPTKAKVASQGTGAATTTKIVLND